MCIEAHMAFFFCSLSMPLVLHVGPPALQALHVFRVLLSLTCKALAVCMYLRPKKNLTPPFTVSLVSLSLNLPNKTAAASLDLHRLMPQTGLH